MEGLLGLGLGLGLGVYLYTSVMASPWKAWGALGRHGVTGWAQSGYMGVGMGTEGGCRTWARRGAAGWVHGIAGLRAAVCAGISPAR